MPDDANDKNQIENAAIVAATAEIIKAWLGSEHDPQKLGSAGISQAVTAVLDALKGVKK